MNSLDFSMLEVLANVGKSNKQNLCIQMFCLLNSSRTHATDKERPEPVRVTSAFSLAMNTFSIPSILN